MDGRVRHVGNGTATISAVCNSLTRTLALTLSGISSYEDIEQAERGLEWAKSSFDENEIECNTHLLIRGLAPGEDLVQFAEENKVDEIVVGVKRRSKVGKLLMGSTAQYIILQASCPVVCVK